MAADVLHHDVADHRTAAWVRVVHEVVDLDDGRVLDLGQEPAFGHRDGHRLAVTSVQQSFEDHPAVVDVAVVGQVDASSAASKFTTSASKQRQHTHGDHSTSLFPAVNLPS
jgi:acyl-coenzyme A synthetase/AMP-(fatty) acid ligase